MYANLKSMDKDRESSIERWVTFVETYGAFVDFWLFRGTYI